MGKCELQVSEIKILRNIHRPETDGLHEEWKQTDMKELIT